MAADTDIALMEARTIDVAIARPWPQVYEAVWRPETFACWASGLARGNLRVENGTWHADGPDGPVTIVFTPHNDAGIMDHRIDTGAPAPVHVPMRIVEDGTGALATITVFRQPGMTDRMFARDCDWVRRDLEALRDWVLAN